MLSGTRKRIDLLRDSSCFLGQPNRPSRLAAFAIAFGVMAGIDVEQTAPGTRPPAALVASFDGMGVGFEGPQGTAALRNPSDNSLAVGPDHIVQTVNSRMAVFTKKGKRFDTTGRALSGPVNTNAIFKDFGGPCETYNNGDAVVRYDQLADRWLLVMPIFRRLEPPALDAARAGLEALERPHAPYAMCYAVSAGADPLGPYHRYEFQRTLFPDYPRPAIWAWQVYVDWRDPSKTRAVGPKKIAVAPYRYLCGGQLTNCVPQPGSERRLDAQGDKIMPRLVYRRVNGHESIVAVHSVTTAAGGGGVRWYEFRIDGAREVTLFQQGTYAPDALFRWMASPAMDRSGNIGIGYSFGGGSHFAGQRFAGRLAADPPGRLTLRETVLVEGEAAQNVMRWEDYSQTAVDPGDDCTIWYVGDYIKKDAASYSSRIGAFRMPGCSGRN
jgi:hypothetical protein